MVNVGRNILEARKRAGLTQEELAARVGYKTKSAINKIELGVRDLPQKKIAQFADALGVTPGQLMGWEDAPEVQDDLGYLAAQVLRDPGMLQMVQDYMTLSDADQHTVRALVASLAGKKKD